MNSITQFSQHTKNGGKKKTTRMNPKESSIYKAIQYNVDRESSI
jgi:hypothetical protein